MSEHAIFPDFSAFQMDLPSAMTRSDPLSRPREASAFHIGAAAWPDFLPAAWGKR
ncbi:hypothetical protein [Arthrobacter oryzae]|jgi:hypothetical protein|uniref:hypothetical protein n=1 Tax=Arthrobacter oryzae TaxID=409290 RepID=UPI00278A1C64|nr:hypothetical protein [Arthrobacter oryzae]MDQ0076614.1 hypothetical protein [Arthrobacter oryzae]